jgi:hypothetical protein
MASRSGCHSGAPATLRAKPCRIRIDETKLRHPVGNPPDAPELVGRLNAAVTVMRPPGAIWPTYAAII